MSKKRSKQVPLSLVMQVVESPRSALLDPGTPLVQSAVDPDEIDFTLAQNNPSRIPIEALRVSLVPESYFVSIASIITESDLEFNEGNEVYSSEEVYRCQGTTTQECLVELSNPTAVQNLLKESVLKIEREINPEDPQKVLTTVRSLAVNRCVNNGRTTLYKLKAKTNYFGYTWYTTNNGKVLTTREED